jgi:hypothetical protein
MGVVDLVFLHGVPASGKLTTARALEVLVGIPVFHNHLVVDALSAVFPFGSAPFVRLREQVWLDVFAAAAHDGRSLTFTFPPEATVTPGFPARVRQAVHSASGQVHFVRLRVGDAIQEERIGNPDRRQFHKLTDLTTLRRLRDQSGDGEQPPVDLEIDSEQSTPQQSAQQIIDRFALLPQPRMARYPSSSDPLTGP